MVSDNPFLDRFRTSFPAVGQVRLINRQHLPSWFEVSEFASAAMAVAGAEASAYFGGGEVTVDQRLAGAWFQSSLRPLGWTLPPSWDPVSGDYRTSDGWIRLHTNAPHHRQAALSVLEVPADRQTVAAAVSKWSASPLEHAIVAFGGAAAKMRSLDEWSAHQQGMAVASEPLIHWKIIDGPSTGPVSDRVKILDLTRVLAGPVATRFLAGLGFDVLRIDPPGWDEPGVVADVTLGKRCATLDLKSTDGLQRFFDLVRQADVLVHGLRPGALDGLGCGIEALRQQNPALIDVCLNAYGWTGPWRERRGYDSLLQMSTGIAAYGMRLSEAEKPRPLPVQALDHVTGYLMAAAVLKALRQRRDGKGVCTAKLSLARVAGELIPAQRKMLHEVGEPIGAVDYQDQIEQTGFGPGRRLRPAVSIEGVSLGWDIPAGPLHRHGAAFQD